MQNEPETPQEEAGLDDFMDSIGLDVKPISPEHAFMIYQTGGGGYKKIHNYRWWIRHEIFGWFDLVENNLPPCKRVVDQTTKTTSWAPATREEYVLARTKYYLRIHNLPWFNSDMSGIGIADIDKTAQMMIEHEDIAPLLTAKKDDMPRNI